MALFANMVAAEIRCRQQMTAKVWLVAHAARNSAGQIICRYYRPMSPTQRSEGAWVETAQDNVN